MGSGVTKKIGLKVSEFVDPDKRRKRLKKERIFEERKEAIGIISDESLLSKDHRGRRVEDFYTIGNNIGRGATADVYVAKEKSTGKRFAIKVLSKERIVRLFGRNILQRSRQALRTEIKLGLTLQHKNVTQLRDVFESKSYVYAVMEYCDGGELFHYIQTCSSIRESHIAKIIFQITSALQYLHSMDVLHRDLKPANVLVCMPPYDNMRGDRRSAAGVTVKLTDFGLSKQLAFGKGTTDSFVGTPSHMAPEMYNKNRKYGSSADMWSLGVLSYILLSGTRPFSEREVMDMAKGRPMQLNFPGSNGWNIVSKVAKDFVRRLLMFRPEDRMSAQDALRHKWLLGLGRRSDSKRRDSKSKRQMVSKKQDVSADTKSTDSKQGKKSSSKVSSSRLSKDSSATSTSAKGAPSSEAKADAAADAAAKASGSVNTEKAAKIPLKRKSTLGPISDNLLIDLVPHLSKTISLRSSKNASHTENSSTSRGGSDGSNSRDAPRGSRPESHAPLGPRIP